MEAKFKKAIVANDISTVRACLLDDDYLNTGLSYACTEGEVEVVQVLISEGADVHFCNDEPICLAAERGHVKVVKVLIDRGANVHAKNDYSFFKAAWNGYFECLRVLMSAGNVHTRDGFIFVWAAQCGRVDILKVILEGADMPIKNRALCKAAKNGHAQVVSFLLAEGANPRVYDYKPFRLAALNSHTETFKLLLAECNLTEIDTRDLSACAVQDEQMTVLSFLMKSVLGKRQTSCSEHNNMHKENQIVKRSKPRQ